MRNVLPIFRREMFAYFYSPVAYIVITVIFDYNRLVFHQ